MIEDEFQLLLRDLNQRLPSPLKDDQLRMVFSKWWPDLNSEYTALLARLAPDNALAKSNRMGAGQARERGLRNDRELLEEILERIRALPAAKRQVDVSPNLHFARQALTRIIEARPTAEVELLMEINRLKDEKNQDAVEALAKSHGATLQSLMDVGLVWRSDEDGKIVLNRFVGNVILPAIKSSLSESGGQPAAE